MSGRDELLALAAAVERAVSGSYGMECQIAAELSIDYRRSPPAYTVNINDALLLLPEGFMWACGSCGEENMPWACITEIAEPCRDFSADAATVPLAIVAAALRARAEAE